MRWGGSHTCNSALIAHDLGRSWSICWGSTERESWSLLGVAGEGAPLTSAQRLPGLSSVRSMPPLCLHLLGSTGSFRRP